MNTLNLIFLIVGIIVTALGFASLVFPSLTQFINSPGGPRIKAVVAICVGIILLLVGVFTTMPA